MSQLRLEEINKITYNRGERKKLQDRLRLIGDTCKKRNCTIEEALEYLEKKDRATHKRQSSTKLVKGEKTHTKESTLN